MGGVAGGLAALIGGTEAPAMQYGQQVRNLLEQRRTHLSDMLANVALQSNDPDLQAKLFGITSKIAGGSGDWHKFIPDALTALQEHAQNTTALAKAVGGSSTPLPTRAAPTAVGQPQGTSTQPAAQPATSPIGGGSLNGILAGTAPPATAPPEQAFTPMIAGGALAGKLAGTAPPATAPPESLPPVGQTSSVSPQASTSTSAITPPPQAAETPSIVPLSGSPQLTIQNPQDIINRWTSHPLYNSGFGRSGQENRALITSAMNTELSHNEALRQYYEQAQAALEIGLQKIGAINSPQVVDYVQKLKASGYPEIMIPGLVGGAFGITVPSISPVLSSMYGRPIMETHDTSTMSPQEKASYGIPSNASGMWTVERNRFDQSVERAYQGGSGFVPTVNAAGETGIESRNQALANGGQLTAPGGGSSQAPSNLRQIQGQNPATGQPATQSPAQAQANIPPTPLGVTPTSQLPRNNISTLNVPGQLPQTTAAQRTVGGVRAAGSAASPANITPGESLLQRKYDDWATGKVVPTGKEMSAVQSYAAKNDLPSPTSLSAAGQKDLAMIDDVLAQISRAKGIMEKNKLQDKDDRGLYTDYVEYMHGGTASKYQDLWTSLSFEGLRSAAAALRGTNARAYGIISRALEHTPQPNASLSLSNPKLPDTPKKMYGQLTTMQDVLNQGRSKVLEDEKKGGILPPVTGATSSPGAGGGTGSPQVVQWGRDAQGNPVRIK